MGEFVQFSCPLDSFSDWFLLPPCAGKNIETTSTVVNANHQAICCGFTATPAIHTSSAKINAIRITKADPPLRHGEIKSLPDNRIEGIITRWQHSIFFTNQI